MWFGNSSIWSSDMYFLPVECDVYFVNILNILREINILLVKLMIMYVPHSIIKL